MHYHSNYRDLRGRKQKQSEKSFEEIIVQKFPKMGKEIVNQLKEEQRVPYRINPRRNTLRHIKINLQKLNTEKEY